MNKQAIQLAWTIAARETNDFFQARDHSRLLLQGSRAVRDTEVVDYLREQFNQDLLAQGLNDGKNLTRFVRAMRPWLLSHRSNSITGLENYQADFSAGTTQAFDSFYYRHRGRRMRCFVGEYFYHLKTWISNNTNWDFVTNTDPLQPGDALVISVPFCDTGSMFNSFDQVIDMCEQLNIPVLVDCCYYTISGNIQADLSSDAIDTVAFSLSKAFPVANLRIGVRYTRPDIFDGQKLHDSILSAWIGLQLIKQFPSDYIYNRYREQQQQVCEQFNLTASDSVLFAQGDSTWDYYNRGNLLETYKLDFTAQQFCNRISLVSIFDNWDIFEAINETTS
jgi:hypothetical protein